jgi:hypothetical protein
MTGIDELAGMEAPLDDVMEINVLLANLNDDCDTGVITENVKEDNWKKRFDSTS